MGSVVPSMGLPLQTMVNIGDAFNVSIAATARAEMAARGWSVDDLLARLPQGVVSRRTLFRLVDPEPPPDRDAPTWRASYIAAVAEAFDLTPYQFVAEAERRGAQLRGEAMPPTGDHAMPPVGGDLRSLAAWLLTHPDLDPELNNRLSDADSQSGVSGKRLAALRETIRLVRREELQRALDALPPSKAQGGGTATG